MPHLPAHMQNIWDGDLVRDNIAVVRIFVETVLSHTHAQVHVLGGVPVLLQEGAGGKMACSFVQP